MTGISPKNEVGAEQRGPEESFRVWNLSGLPLLRSGGVDPNLLMKNYGSQVTYGAKGDVQG